MADFEDLILEEPTLRQKPAPQKTPSTGAVCSRSFCNVYGVSGRTLRRWVNKGLVEKTVDSEGRYLYRYVGDSPVPTALSADKRLRIYCAYHSLDYEKVLTQAINEWLSPKWHTVKL